MAPNLQRFPSSPITSSFNSHDDDRIKCALLGTGMMGQEHISYIMGFSNQIRIDYLCDPFQPSLDKARKIMNDFAIADPVMADKNRDHQPIVFTDEEELFEHVDDIDLLIIASPNYTHTPILMRWGRNDITILVEKPVAVSQQQHDDLVRASSSPDWKARIWVAMEYRYIPAIAKLLELVPLIGETKMMTIRENRYPFLHKIGKWNRDVEKTGDTLVEKCCHFFDLFRLISSKGNGDKVREAQLPKVRALAQRGINYGDEDDMYERPIIDSAYVTMPFKDANPSKEGGQWMNTIGCLELCMFSEGSRHQEEIIVTGTAGRVEAYLPENKVYFFERPNHDLWNDRSVPPPPESIKQQVFDCSDVRAIHSIEGDIPTHSGYHYCSTAVEWCYLLSTIQKHKATGEWTPHVSLNDGLRAVELGIVATSELVNELDDE
mmetsp:Transcript_43550/g.105577  ORF Transcript_43550/g.105577 Transcript_43550/m.105577 type:complete len:434 (+) Transcript_43550:283-1584(+)